MKGACAEQRARGGGGCRERGEERDKEKTLKGSVFGQNKTRNHVRSVGKRRWKRGEQEEMRIRRDIKVLWHSKRHRGRGGEGEREEEREEQGEKHFFFTHRHKSLPLSPPSSPFFIFSSRYSLPIMSSLHLSIQERVCARERGARERERRVEGDNTVHEKEHSLSFFCLHRFHFLSCLLHPHIFSFF
jgi:hypothetical protein